MRGHAMAARWLRLAPHGLTMIWTVAYLVSVAASGAVFLVLHNRKTQRMIAANERRRAIRLAYEHDRDWLDQQIELSGSVGRWWGSI